MFAVEQRYGFGVPLDAFQERVELGLGQRTAGSETGRAESAEKIDFVQVGKQKNRLERYQDGRRVAGTIGLIRLGSSKAAWSS